MKLTEKQVIQLVKEPQTKVTKRNIAEQDNVKIHIEGVGFETALCQIIGYESVEQFKQKKLLTKPFTRPLFKKIINAQSRWKSAWGTSKYYKFKKNTEKLQKEFKDVVLAQVWKNGSMDQFIKNFLSRAIYQEFNGFFVVEKPRVEEIDGVKYAVKNEIPTILKPEDQLNLKPYICFYAAEDVHAFKVNGNKVEFLVLKYGEIERNGRTICLYRVIDDVYDYVVEQEGESIIISTEYAPIEHKAGQCPASSVTFINKSITDDRTKASPVDEIIDALDYHLHQFAEHLVTEILHAHPNFFQIGQRCTHYEEGAKCEEGTLYFNTNGVKSQRTCPNCNGTGHNLKKDASTTLILPAKDDEGKALNLSNVMGYVSPPVDAMEYQLKAIDWMENKILESATGIKNFSATDQALQNTATGVIENLRPLEDIIGEIIDIIEGVEKNLTDIIGKMYYGDAYIGSEIIYGRKLVLRDENSVVKEISASKEAGVSNTHIKALNEELTYTRFIRSEIDLQRNIILAELEPLIGYTFEEVESAQTVSAKTKVLKQNFNDFIQRFELENGSLIDFMAGSDDATKIAAIKTELDKYVEETIAAITPSGGGANLSA